MAVQQPTPAGLKSAMEAICRDIGWDASDPQVEAWARQMMGLWESLPADPLTAALPPEAKDRLCWSVRTMVDDEKRERREEIGLRLVR